MPLGTRIGAALGRQSIRFTAGSMESATIERNLILRGLQLNVAGTLNVTAATDNQPADIKLGDFESIIRQITVRANGSDTLFQMSGNDLWNLNRYFNRCPPTNSPALGDNTTTAISLDTSLKIPFERIIKGEYFDDHLVDTRRLNSLTVDIQWGNVDDLTLGAGRVLSNVFANITPYGFARTDSKPENERIYAPLRRTLQTLDITGAGDFSITLNGGPIYTSLLLNTVNASGNEAQIITNMSLESGTTKIAEFGWANLNRHGEAECGIQGLTYGRKSTAASQFGWVFWPHAYKGVSEGIDTFELGEVKLKGTALAAGKLRVFGEAVTPAVRVNKNVALTVDPV